MNSLKRFQALIQVAEFGYRASSAILRTYTPANFSSFLSPSITLGNTGTLRTSKFLTPTICNTVQVCGMKVRGKVHKRCRDCYMVYKDHRVFNYCKTKPKHNQMNKVAKEKEYFIFTEVTRGRVRKY